MSGAILWCPDLATMDAVGTMTLDGEHALTLIERDDDRYTAREHALRLIDAITREADEGNDAPTILVGAEAFGWCCTGMMRELRIWLEEHEHAGSVVVTYVGPGRSQLGHGDVSSFTTPAVSHPPSMMAPETVVRLSAMGACNLSDPVGREWLERYVRGLVPQALASRDEGLTDDERVAHQALVDDVARTVSPSPPRSGDIPAICGAWFDEGIGDPPVQCTEPPGHNKGGCREGAAIEEEGSVAAAEAETRAGLEDEEQERLVDLACGPCADAGQAWTCARVLSGQGDAFCDGPRDGERHG